MGPTRRAAMCQYTRPQFQDHRLLISAHINEHKFDNTGLTDYEGELVNVVPGGI
jgi:hypothetical protein